MEWLIRIFVPWASFIEKATHLLDTIILELTWQVKYICLVYKYLFRGVRNSFIYFKPSESDALDRWGRFSLSFLYGHDVFWPLQGTATGSSSLRWAPVTSWCWARTSPRVTPLADLTGGSAPTLHSAPCPPEVDRYLEVFSFHMIIIFLGLLSLTLTSCPSETFTCQSG